jgi:GTP cyclohydrolase II
MTNTSEIAPANPDPTYEPAPKRFQCRHILPAGRRCRSASLRGEQFCYYHHTTRRPAPTAGKFRYLDAAEPFPLPIIEDRTSALLVASQILCRIASNDLDPTRAGRLLYGLQVIACFLPGQPRPLSVTRNFSSSAPEDNAPGALVEDLILDSDLGPIAPIAELPAHKDHEESRRSLFVEMLDGLIHPAPEPGPAANQQPATNRPPIPPRHGRSRTSLAPYNRTMPFESVRQLADADFPTRWGHFRIHGFEGIVANSKPCNAIDPPPASRVETAVALVLGDITSPEPPIVRVHSQCLTGDVFHSLRCDCRQQLELALAAIAAAGRGILIYENKEGRGIGLMAKLQAYQLQDQGLDTVEANLELGFQADCRQYELPAAILKALGVRSVRLITNNPEKVAALESVGIQVAERLSAEVPPEPTFERYLQTKQEKLGHLVS